jgi:multisubunit Na+/H+ antiporter MnhF subunit
MTTIQTVWLAAGTAFTSLVLPCVWIMCRRGVMSALVALELAGAVTTLALVCLAVGFQRSSYASLPILAGIMTFVGALVFVRFLGGGHEHV